MPAKNNPIEYVISRARDLIGQNDHKQAYKLCRKAASSGASHPEFLFIHAIAAFHCKKSSEAIKLLRNAIRLHPDFEDALFNLGYIANFSSQPYEAIEPLERLVGLCPDYPNAYTNLAVACFSVERFQRALEACIKAIERVPDTPDAAELYNLLGSIYRDLELNQLSEEAFKKVLQINPNYDDALANMAMMLEESSQLESAEKVSREGMERFAGNLRFSLVLAKCERRRGDVREPIERLSQTDLKNETPDFQASVFYELGRLWDRENNADKAFNCFSKANNITATQVPSNIKKGHFPKLVRAASKFYGQNTFPDFRNQFFDDGLIPCFLIGFPRSGTTLLEMTLAGHSDVAVMEETPLLMEMYSSINESNQFYPMVLDDLDDERIRDLRKTYFERASDFTDFTDKRILINKHPMDTVYLPIIRSVFPDAKVIFSTRHPADVCLSCWMQEFKLNASNVNFLNLEDTVEFYSACMDLWMHFEKHAGLDFHIVSYESIVDDHKETARKTIEFLGLDWQQAILNHTGTAGNLPRVNTASYQQVAEPIYARSKYRWEKYHEHLREILPKLQQYMKHFGYNS